MGFEVTPAEALWAGTQKVHLQAWVPDTDAGNRLTGVADAIRAEWKAKLEAAGRWVPDAWTAKRDAVALWQVVPLDSERVVVGKVWPNEAISLAPGGRHRMHRGDSPSRAAMKLEEALDGLGWQPGKGDRCVDLGAAPGGWTARLIGRGAHVTAVDPGLLTPELMRDRRVRHVKGSAFTYVPDAPVDWLFCDMAWRPLEVAQLLGKWARNGWASMVVANLKLPMKDKLPMVMRARHVLREAGWGELRIRQLYHDRDEVTVVGRVL